MLGSAAHDVDTLGRKDREGKRLGELRPRAGTLTIHQHPFGRVAYSPGQREVT